MKKPELLAPAGSFLAAYQALEAGADGIYLGLKDFSARKAAQNFSLDQLRRIRRLAADRARRVYVTLNTVIRESELGSLRETLAWLEALDVDAVIVQDLGVCEIIARCFPRLVMHASTQMAVHDERGLRAARDLGVRRVILPRELPLARIRELRQRVPDVELEVFIHGALCYSFSGVCLASWALTGRSGNRGDCAQICRSSFTGQRETAAATAAGGEQECGGHLFSCRDLFLGRDVLALAEAGVHSLKIEGRMKSPEYVFNVTRLYRQVLDRGAELSASEYDELERRVELSFSRQKTTGWLRHSAGSGLIDVSFPGHRGPVIGTVETARGRGIGLRVSADISLRDGLGFFVPGEEAPIAFPVMRLKKGGAEVRFARAGDSVLVELPEGTPAPRPGTEILHMSSRFLDLPQPREASFPLYKVAREVRATMREDGSLELCSPGFEPFPAHVSLAEAKQRRPFAGILEDLLRESGDSLFTPSAVVFQNGSGLADDGIFVPPSQLKKVKNDFYSYLDAAFLEGMARRGEPAGRSAEPARPSAEPVGWSAKPGPAAAASRLSAADAALLADRRRISPPACAPVPFVDADPARLDVGSLAQLAGCLWLPLPPVILEDRGWEARLIEAAREAGDRGAALAVGLNNLSHVALAEELAGHANIVFFIDFYLYAANSRTLALVRQKVPRLLFAYAWIEGSREDALALAEAAGDLPVVPIAQGFRAPLFYSMGCFARHVLNDGKCYEDCPKDFTRDLRQGKTAFQVVVRDCVTWLFKL